jgi:hypothetical protein
VPNFGTWVDRVWTTKTSFDVLDLLAHLLDQHFQLHRGPGRLHILRLRRQRIRLAVWGAPGDPSASVRSCDACAAPPRNIASAAAAPPPAIAAIPELVPASIV